MSQATSDAERQAIVIAKQEITEQRTRYARATDLIATGGADGEREGRSIYQQIYTADATISASGIDPVSGPDAWFDTVKDALETYSATQHLVGSILVHALTLPDAQGNGGEAQVSAYLQAWHSTPEHNLYMFVGTYHDYFVYSADNGWQIAKMHLEKTADELRDFTPR